jgi:hypothetical protein
MEGEAKGAMAVITLGYKNYVMPVEAAVTIAEAMAQGELYERKYRTNVEGGSTYHIYPADEDAVEAGVTLISRARYCMAKLAGKPE